MWSSKWTQLWQYWIIWFICIPEYCLDHILSKNNEHLTVKSSSSSRVCVSGTHKITQKKRAKKQRKSSILHTIRKVNFLSKNSILVKSKLSTAKKSQTAAFSRVFHPKQLDNFSREINVEFWTLWSDQHLNWMEAVNSPEEVSIKIRLEVANGHAEVTPIPKRVRMDQFELADSRSCKADRKLSGKLNGSKTSERCWVSSMSGLLHSSWFKPLEQIFRKLNPRLWYFVEWMWSALRKVVNPLLAPQGSNFFQGVKFSVQTFSPGSMPNLIWDEVILDCKRAPEGP